MHMPVLTMIVMDCCYPCNICACLLYNRIHCFFGDLLKKYVALRILCLCIRADLKTEKCTPLLRFINHPVRLMPPHCSIDTKECPGSPPVVFPWPVLNIPDVGFCRAFAFRVGC